MKTVQEIEEAIEKLPEEDYVRLAEWFERWLAEKFLEVEEDCEDIEAARISRAEPGQNIPREQVRAEAGLE